MYCTVVTIRTTSLTFTNSTFCPHSVFVCFVWISEQPEIRQIGDRQKQKLYFSYILNIYSSTLSIRLLPRLRLGGAMPPVIISLPDVQETT